MLQPRMTAPTNQQSMLYIQVPDTALQQGRGHPWLPTAPGMAAVWCSETHVLMQHSWCAGQHGQEPWCWWQCQSLPLPGSRHLACPVPLHRQHSFQRKNMLHVKALCLPSQSGAKPAKPSCSTWSDTCCFQPGTHPPYHPPPNPQHRHLATSTTSQS